MIRQALKQKWWYRLLTLVFSLVVITSNVLAAGALYVNLMAPDRLVCANGREEPFPYSNTPMEMIKQCDQDTWFLLNGTQNGIPTEQRQEVANEALSKIHVVGGITPERIFLTIAGLFALNLFFFALRRAFFFVLLGQSLFGKSESSQKPGFFSKFIRGEFALSRTFWTFGLGVNLVLTLVGRGSEYDTGDSTLRIFMVIIQLLYFPFIFISVWRSANRYEGLKVWAVLAKAYFVFVLLAIIIVQLGILDID